MRFTFVLLKPHKNLNLKGWYLKISSIEEYMNYHEKIGSNDDYKTFDNLKKAAEGKAHYQGASYLLNEFILPRKAKEKNKNSFTFVELVNEISEFKSGSKIKSLLKYGTIYINCVGGYCFPTDDSEELEIIEKDEPVFPNYTKDNINVIKWPGGSHFYCKIGNIDVTDQYGNQKWNTRSAAYEEGLKFLKEYNKTYTT